MRYVLLLIVFFLLEGLVTSIPLILNGILLIFIISKSNRVLLAAFVLGILQDTFKLHTLGISSMYYLIVLFLVSLYERKFEIHTVPFILVASFLGSMGYLLFFSKTQVFLQAGLNAMVAVLLFQFLILNFKFLIKS